MKEICQILALLFVQQEVRDDEASGPTFSVGTKEVRCPCSGTSDNRKEATEDVEPELLHVRIGAQPFSLTGCRSPQLLCSPLEAMVGRILVMT